jgi:hypothetical protein
MLILTTYSKNTERHGKSTCVFLTATIIAETALSGNSLNFSFQPITPPP